jgi:hypothetical protein
VTDIFIKDFPEDLHYQIKVQAAVEKTTMKGIIIKAVEEYLKKKKGR